MSIGLGTRVVTKRTKARENKAQESGHKKNSNALNTYLLSPKETFFFQEKKENQQTDKTMSYAPTGKGVGGYLVVKGHAVRQWCRQDGAVFWRQTKRKVWKRVGIWVKHLQEKEEGEVGGLKNVSIFFC